MNTEISQERIKRFWKWCGFKKAGVSWIEGVYKYPIDPPESIFDGKYALLPPVDLNSLFKYAVPKVLEKIGRERLVALVNNALCDSIEAKVDVKDYLFLAIEKLIAEGQ